MKIAAAFLFAASTLCAQQQPQPAPPHDVAEGTQVPASKTTPGTPPTPSAAPAVNQPGAPAAFDTRPLRWRAIGPANMGGRIADFAVVEKEPTTMYVAVGTGGGETWTNMGLPESHDIPKVALDPKNDDVAYVAVLGHLWGTNKERGVYK